MIRPSITALFITAALGSPAFASPELARQKNCMACHAVATKMVGPAFNAIAAKYAGDGAGAKALAGKIQKGSKGVWGTMPMPPNPQVNDTEASALATWIMNQKGTP
jgi:cytochrome c